MLIKYAILAANLLFLLIKRKTQICGGEEGTDRRTIKYIIDIRRVQVIGKLHGVPIGFVGPKCFKYLS